MKAIRSKSPIDSMYTHAIQADDGRIYSIEKSWTGELFCNTASGVPTIETNTIVPFQGMAPDQEHKAIKKLIANAVRAFDKRARHQAMLDLGLTRVKGALGGVYYE